MNPDEPVFLRLPRRLIGPLASWLEGRAELSTANNVREFTKHYTDPELNAEREKWVERAREQCHSDGEVEIDADATISETDETEGGQYVLAWVWVSGEDES